VLVASLPTTAHEPTPNRDGDGYTSGQTLQRLWSSSYPPTSWVKAGVDLAIDHAPNSGANLPTFSTSTGIDGVIYYRSRSGSRCADLPSTVWACADNNLTDNEWHITFLPQGASAGSGSIDWCEAHSPDATSGCVRADRIAIHELGHVLDLDHYPGNDPSDDDITVMRATTPNVNYTGGTATSFRTCDRARLYMKHGPNSPTVSWPTCLDHVTGGVSGVGLDTIIGLSITDESPCRYQSVAFSGTLKTNDVDGQPSNTRAKPLQGREVRLQRRAYGSSDAFETVHSGDTTSSTGYFYITHEFTSIGAWEYRSRFAGEDGLSGDVSSVHTVNVLPC
jgi:hypothetical protein